MKKAYVDLPSLSAYGMMCLSDVPGWLIVNTAAQPENKTVRIFPRGNLNEREAKALRERLNLYPGKAAVSFE